MGNFSLTLKSLRTSRGMTQDELSKILKISRSTIGMYESGSREPDYETLELIADYFNVDTDYLLGRSNKTTMIPGYYINDETRQVAQDLHDNKELSLLFDAARDADPEDLKTVHSMLLALKRKEQDR